MEHQLKAVLDFKGKDVYTVEPASTVLDAVHRMNEKRVGALLVVDGDKPVGMFTERDILRRVADPGWNPAEARVSDLMSTQLVAMEPKATIEEAMAVMTERRCRHIPVLENDRLVGLVSIGDLTRWVSRRQADHIQDLVNYITGKYPA